MESILRSSWWFCISCVVLIVAYISTCGHSNHDKKVFILDFDQIPSNVSLSEKERSHCRWSAYNAELILYQSLLLNPGQRHVRAKSLSEATHVMIPFFGSCYLFNCWTQSHWNQSERCDVDSYTIRVMQWAFGQFPNKSLITFQPMDHVDTYYNATSRSLLSKTMYLVCNADWLPTNETRSHWRPHIDIPIPSATHLINSYHVHPRDYLDAYGRPLVQGVRSSMVEVSTHVDLDRSSLVSRRYSTQQRNSRPMTSIQKIIDSLMSSIFEKTKHRHITATFRGSFAPGGETNYGYNLRPYIKTFSHLPSFNIAEASSNHEYALALANSKYGLAPPGYTLDTTRLWEYLAFGVVPVFLGTGPQGSQAMPFANQIDWTSISLYVPPENITALPEILSSIPESQYHSMQQTLWTIARSMLLEDVAGNTWNWIQRDL